MHCNESNGHQGERAENDQGLVCSLLAWIEGLLGSLAKALDPLLKPSLVLANTLNPLLNPFLDSIVKAFLDSLVKAILAP